MTQEKQSSASSGFFGLTGRDISLLFLLIIALGINFIPNAWFARFKDTSSLPSSPTETTIPATTEVAAVATNQPSSPTPPPPPTDTPTQEPTATPTETSTSTPTTEPTVEVTAEPTVEQTTEPTVEATTEPTVEATAEPTVEQTTKPAVEKTTEPPADSPSKPTEKAVIEPAKIIYVKRIADTHALSLVASDGTPIVGDLQRYAVAPAWSPDGTEIAFFGEPGIEKLGGVFAQGEGIWTINPETRVARQICRKNDVKSIAGSPDGTKLAYEFEQANKVRKVLVVDSGDCNNSELYYGYDGQQPAWRNSEELAIRVPVPDSRGPAGLRIVNINDDNQTQLTTQAVDGFPSWSSDGQYLAFEKQSGNSDIYLIKWDGPNWQTFPLVTHPGKDTTPAFGPDNKEIYFLSDDSGEWQLRAVSLDGKNEYVVVDDVGTIDDWGLARPAVTKP